MAQPPIVDITHPLIIKDGELCLLCDRAGRIESAPELGLGLLHRDCRFLCRYELRIGGQEPLVLMHSAVGGFITRFELTNPPIEEKGRRIAEHSLVIARQQAIFTDGHLCLDRLSLRNCTLDPIATTLHLVMEARFEDIFAVRGTPPKQRGRLHPPREEQGVLHFRYDGADGICRRLDVVAKPRPASIHIEPPQAELALPLSLAPQQTVEINIALIVSEAEGEAPDRPRTLPSRREAMAREREIAQHWLDGYARIESDNASLDAALRRSLADLRLLETERADGRFIAAGLPWFVALFGRDSLVPSLQCLAYRPEIAAETLRVLARYQGNRYAAGQQKQPGKILHELRVGEMARLGEVSQHPSYATVDATVLYLIALGRHAQWSGSTALFEELRGAVERALAWMDGDGDGNGDGYIDYDAGSGDTPANQGWKDSADAIPHPSGELVFGRIALAEVQGYAYLAKRLIAELYRRIGESQPADRLDTEAEALHRRFNRDFWMAEAGCYCLGLDGEGRQIGVISSNAGQALWSGIADADKAQATAARLMQPDMFSGWGVRTLSERERRFNPIGYHTGGVWPFDNSFILAGFRRYGLDDPARRMFDALLDAAGYFDDCRLPEFFSGVARQEGAGPARCPRADPLQAWSAGALPYMLVSLLGLEPDGFARRLRVIRPSLPARIDRLDLDGVRVGEATVDLRFERRAGQVEVLVLQLEGSLDIEG